MGRLICVLFLLMIACNTKRQNANNEISKRDSAIIATVKKQYEFQRYLDSLEHATTDSILIAKIRHYKEKNDGNIMMSINYKQAHLKNLYMEDKIHDMEKNIQFVAKQVEDYRKKYVEVVRDNEGYKYKLNYEIEGHAMTKKQKAILEKEVEKASELKIVSVKAIGSGVSPSLFGKAKEINTNIAKKIKYVGVFYTFPANELAKKEEKKISVIMYAANGGADEVRKDTSIQYDGKEHDIMTKLVSKKELQVGSHLINITINGKSQSSIEFNVASK